MRKSSTRLFRKHGCAAAMAVVLALSGTFAGPFVLPAYHAANAAVSGTPREKLAPYGTWRRSTRFGEVWAPSVPHDWRPYTNGRWVWTDEGWYWQSDEPFGWVVYHYGHWVFDDELGWVWISGDEWAPAWVVWREGADDIGWAPAPPPDVDVVVADNWWSFVPVVAIGAASILPVVRPVVDNVTVIRNTTIINENVVVNHPTASTARLGDVVVPVNSGPVLARLPRDVEHSVKAAKVAPPAKGAIAQARLDPSKGAAVKAQAAKTSKQAAGAAAPAGQPNATAARPAQPGAANQATNAAPGKEPAKQPNAPASAKPVSPKQADAAGANGAGSAKKAAAAKPTKPQVAKHASATPAKTAAPPRKSATAKPAKPPAKHANAAAKAPPKKHPPKKQTES